MRYLFPLLALLIIYGSIFLFGHSFSPVSSFNDKIMVEDVSFGPQLPPEAIVSLGELDSLLSNIVLENYKIRTDPDLIISYKDNEILKLSAYAAEAALSASSRFHEVERVIAALEGTLDEERFTMISEGLLMMRNTSKDNFALFLSVINAKTTGNVSDKLKSNLNIVNDNAIKIENLYLDINMELREYMGL